MGGGSGSSNSTISQSLLPDYAQGNVESYLSRSNTLSQTAYTTYSGSTYATQNQDEIDGIASLATRGSGGHVINTKGETLLRSVFDGLKFNINPKISDSYLKRAEVLVQQLDEELLPSLAHEYNLIGCYGTTAHSIAQAKVAEGVMQKLAEMGLDLYFKDYLEERSSQIGGLAQGVVYGNQSSMDAEILRQAGLYAREYTQGTYEDAFKKWKDEQEASIKRLELLGNSIRSLVGAQRTIVEPYYRPSTISQIAGIALTGLSMYASYKSMKSGGELTAAQQVTTLPAEV